MRILSYNCGHDGSAVLVENGRLIFSLESEKDDGLRNLWAIPPSLFARSLQIPEPPDVLALSGFRRRHMVGSRMAHPCRDNDEAGYFEEGAKGKTTGETLFVGRNIRRFSSSHIRSHIMCSYGMSPFPQGQPCYALIWEGRIGAMYYIDEHVNIKKIGDVVENPGARYVFMYGIANPRGLGWEDPAGKIMALAAYGRAGPRTAGQQELIDYLFSFDPWVDGSDKAKFSANPYFNIGVESQEFKDLAWHLSTEMFERFYRFARQHLKRGLPLLIGGGCGLNCEWNSQWRQCDLFSDVFVPPCPNDSGVSIGAAVDALHHYTGEAKIAWSVYAGDPFIDDETGSPDFDCHALNLDEVSRRLKNGDVIAWVQGPYEIGPRALGNRSLLAEPFSGQSRDKLNRIKQRESFRPIAPICLQEDFGRHFDNHGLSPHMLYFQRVKSPELAAITHVDGSARAQSVNDIENPEMCALLREFRKQTGFGVLCNTSLNFKGCGFINRMSHLLVYVRERGVDGFVVGDRFFQRKLASNGSRELSGHP